jgi:hypothetical protein
MQRPPGDRSESARGSKRFAVTVLRRPREGTVGWLALTRGSADCDPPAPTSTSTLPTTSDALVTTGRPRRRAARPRPVPPLDGRREATDRPRGRGHDRRAKPGVSMHATTRSMPSRVPAQSGPVGTPGEVDLARVRQVAMQLQANPMTPATPGPAHASAAPRPGAASPTPVAPPPADRRTRRIRAPAARRRWRGLREVVDLTLGSCSDQNQGTGLDGLTTSPHSSSSSRSHG